MSARILTIQFIKKRIAYSRCEVSQRRFHPRHIPPIRRDIEIGTGTWRTDRHQTIFPGEIALVGNLI